MYHCISTFNVWLDDSTADLGLLEVGHFLSGQLRGKLKCKVL